MNKRLEKILEQLMGRAGRVCAMGPTPVNIHRNQRLDLKAMKQLTDLGLAKQTKTICDGSILVFESTYEMYRKDGFAAFKDQSTEPPFDVATEPGPLRNIPSTPIKVS